MGQRPLRRPLLEFYAVWAMQTLVHTVYDSSEAGSRWQMAWGILRLLTSFLLGYKAFGIIVKTQEYVHERQARIDEVGEE